MRINKFPLIIFVLVSFYTLGLFIAPLTLEPGTVGPLSGGANQISLAEEWEDLPVYHRVIYTFSDFNCHQMHERSYFINDNQMPVCARCMGIFLGLTGGLLVMVFFKPEPDYKDMLLKFVPGEHSRRSDLHKIMILVGLASLVILPMLLDGGLQMVTSHESTNRVRTVTGLIFGFGLSVFLMALLMSTTAEPGENNIYRTLHPSETEDLQ